MIKLEHVVTASPEQMEFIIEGMRNAMNSWDKSDSFMCDERTPVTLAELEEECSKCSIGIDNCPNDFEPYRFIVGENDHTLMMKLRNAGTDHRKYMRMMPVYVRITAPLYWWKEFDTYKVGTVANSCSTMHKIHAKEFVADDFSLEHIFSLSEMSGTIDSLNRYRELYLNTIRNENETHQESAVQAKDYWWQLIQLLPSSYNQTRNVMLNYEVLANIYKSRKNHKLDEWKIFCKWIETLPYSELITGLCLGDVSKGE